MKVGLQCVLELVPLGPVRLLDVVGMAEALQ